MLDEVNHVGPRRTLVEQLAERRVGPEQIDKVLFRYTIVMQYEYCAHIVQSCTLGSLSTNQQRVWSGNERGLLARTFQRRQLAMGWTILRP
jgi:hypothetical protein